MVPEALKERMRKLHETPVLERIAAIKDKLAAAGDEAQELRHLPAWGSAEMVNAGLYRIALPAEVAGEDLSPNDQIAAIEAVSAIDGSVGWNLQISSEINSLVIRTLEPDVADEVYGDWGTIISCAAAPAADSYFLPKQVEGGFLVSHRATFGSGCHNATWIWVTPMNDPSKNVPQADVKFSFVIPQSQVEILDTWNTAGMRGSGSHDIQTKDVFVSNRFASPYPNLISTRYANPTFRNPTQVEYNKAAVALGVARGTIDAFIDLAVDKRPWNAGASLKELPEAQYRLGEAEATLQSARAFLMTAQQELSDDVGPLPPEGNALPSWEALRRARLACTHAAQASRLVVDLIHNTSGTSGSFMSNALERKLRDGHMAAAHGVITYRNYRNFGATYLGVENPNIRRGSRDV